MNDLLTELRPWFSEAVRRRGERYFREGRVDVTRAATSRAEARVEARVEGTHLYRVALKLSGRVTDRRDLSDRIEGHCTCPAWHDTGACKHLWALLLHCESEGLPPVAMRREGSEPWRRRLGALGRSAETSEAGEDPWRTMDDPERRFLFGIDIEGTLEERGAVFNVLVQKRKRSGDWSRPVPASVTLLDSAPASDRALLDVIYGGDHYRYFDRYITVADGVLDWLLPRLCETGRFYLYRDGMPDATPLVFDSGEPWVFGLDISRDDAGCLLDGYLARGETRIPIGEPALLHGGGWVFFDNAVARLDGRGAMDWMSDLRRHGPLRAPGDALPKLLEAVTGGPGRPLLSGSGIALVEEVAPRPCLGVKADTTDVDLPCEITFDYGGTRVDARAAAGHVRAGERLIPRDPDAERAALRQFLAHGGAPARAEDHAGQVKAALLPGLVRALVDAGWTVEAEGKPYRRAGAFKAEVRSGIDWFDLEGAMDFDGESVPLPALLAALRAKARTVRLGDGSVGILPEDWLERWGMLDSVALAGDGSLRFSRNQGWLLDLLLAARPEVQADEIFARLRERIRPFDGIQPGQEPPGFRGTLRHYQREALGWFAFLRDMGLGGCLADDMGLGKTVQVLALLEERRRRDGPRTPSLVVAPKTLVFNWIAEAARFAPELRVIDYTGPARRNADLAACDILVTTYGTLRRDAAELADVQFDYVILDEAQAVKNPRSQAAKAARLLRADHRLALTGTPVENHMGDLWSILDFLNPGMAGRVDAFRALAGGGDIPEHLATALRPFLLRRTKEQVLPELPEKSEQTLYCDLRGAQRKAYDEVRNHYRASLLGAGNGAGGKGKIHVLEALLRLRQAALHPGLLDATRTDAVSAKLEVLLPRIEDVVAEGHKAVVFSQFTSFLAILRRELDGRGIPYEYLDGRTRRRDEKVQRFQESSVAECPLFLVSLKAGGFGLNLTAADYVFLLDPWWNPAVETQAIDRTHRIGQTRKVMAYRIISRDTVEERVLELQQRKRALADAVVKADRTLLESLTREDLELLLA